MRNGAAAFKESKTRIDLGNLIAIGGVDQKQVDIRLEYDPPEHGVDPRLQVSFSPRTRRIQRAGKVDGIERLIEKTESEIRAGM